MTSYNIVYMLIMCVISLENKFKTENIKLLLSTNGLSFIDTKINEKFAVVFRKFILINSNLFYEIDSYFIDKCIFVSLPLGIGKMSFPHFIVYSFAGSIPWTFAFVSAGKKLGENWGIIKVYGDTVNVVIASILVLLVCI